MKNCLVAIVLLYSLFSAADRVYALGEKTITLGAESSWQAMERREGVAESVRIRPHPVLALSNGVSPAGGQTPLDLDLSFNEGHPERFTDSRGRYDVTVSDDLRTAPAPWNRTGNGSALFSGAGLDGHAPLAARPRTSSLFAAGSHIEDFTFEFWLFPQTIENGAQIVSWSSYVSARATSSFAQQLILCAVERNRTQWTFENFFSSADRSRSIPLALSGPLLVPRVWSHHLIRFDSANGLVEYWVDGELEATAFATSTGREGGEVHTPLAGENGQWTLGAYFSGMIDVFRVYSGLAELPAQTKFPARGGRAESRTLDLGKANSRLLKLEAFGGRTTNAAGSVSNEYVSNAALNFSDHSAVHFSIRMSNEMFNWDNSPWIPVKPGADLPAAFRGRYVQIAADFFPSANGQTSPYLSELRVVYQAAEPPPPPTQIVAAARDGAVELSWRASPSRDVGGYLVFFGNAPGEYFGSYAILNDMAVSSPINVGNRTSVRIEGLTNGTLYFFAVTAYSAADAASDGTAAQTGAGEFSREVAARPLMLAAEDGR